MQESLQNRRIKMPKALKINKSAEEGLKELLKSLMENGRIWRSELLSRYQP